MSSPDTRNALTGDDQFDDFEQTVQKISHTMAQMPTKALGMTKQLLNAAMSNTLTAQLDLESELQIKERERRKNKESKLYKDGKAKWHYIQIIKWIYSC